jgi:hypothetical protein
LTQDEIIAMARQADIRDSLEYDHMECDIESLEVFAKLVAQHEREACAEICKKHADVYALLEQNPHAFGTAKPAWAACIDNRDAILAREKA